MHIPGISILSKKSGKRNPETKKEKVVFRNASGQTHQSGQSIHSLKQNTNLKTTVKTRAVFYKTKRFFVTHARKNRFPVCLRGKEKTRINYSTTATTSISTKAPLGISRTATAERAGNTPSKKEAYTSFIAAK